MELDEDDVPDDLGAYAIKNNEHFSICIREFEESTSRCHASSIFKKGYLIIKLLPKCFDKAMRYCSQTRKIFDFCNNYLEDSCNNDFRSDFICNTAIPQ